MKCYLLPEDQVQATWNYKMQSVKRQACLSGQGRTPCSSDTSSSMLHSKSVIKPSHCTGDRSLLMCTAVSSLIMRSSNTMQHMPHEIER